MLRDETTAAGALFFFDLAEDGIYIACRGLMALSLALGDTEIERLLSVVTARLTRWQSLMVT